MLREFAGKQNLYLDKRGNRPARRGRKVLWTDLYGNSHELDYVLERGGTEKKVGAPVAFIETAWRRYTKHSRNKAQEIQGAIQPLYETYKDHAPFIGVILAGVYTAGALGQLKSLGFKVLHFRYQSVTDEFGVVGIKAGFEENTPEQEFRRKVAAWKRLSAKKRLMVKQKLLNSQCEDIQTFMNDLEVAMTRHIVLIRVLPLHGSSVDLPSVRDAIDFIVKYDAGKEQRTLIRFELEVRYSNGDRVLGEFADKDSALEFLESVSSYQQSL